MKALFIFISLGLLSCVLAQTPCFGRIAATERVGDSWEEGDIHYQIWDINATNEGTCPLTRIVGFFSAGAGFISQSWNYDSSSGLITGYGDVLEPGQSFTGAGFILANFSAPILAFDRPGCSEECSSSGTETESGSGVQSESESGSGSGDKSGSETESESGSESGDKSGSETGSGSGSETGSESGTGGESESGSGSESESESEKCNVEVSISTDSYFWFDSEGRNNSVYRVEITNTGTCPLIHYVLSFGYFPGTLISSWNLRSTLGGYEVIGYGPALGAGQSYNGAGLIIADAPDEVSPDPYGSACAC